MGVLQARCRRSGRDSLNLIQSILAKIEANVAGADDALMLDTRGYVAETTRGTVLELCCAHDIPYDVRDLSLTQVHTADEVFVTGTMGELVPVTAVDGRTIGDGRQGAVTGRPRELYAELTAAEGVPVC